MDIVVITMCYQRDGRIATPWTKQTVHVLHSVALYILLHTYPGIISTISTMVIMDEVGRRTSSWTNLVDEQNWSSYGQSTDDRSAEWRQTCSRVETEQTTYNQIQIDTTTEYKRIQQEDTRRYSKIVS